MRALRCFLVLALAMELLAGCALFRRKPRPGGPAAPRFVGTIAYVDAGHGFVLVDVGGLYSPDAGRALKAFRGGEETAVLAVSAERRRPFVSADVAKGEPRRGDLVYE